MLASIPLLLAWYSRQGIGGELAGSIGRVQADGPGQPHMLLGRVGLAESISGPMETNVGVAPWSSSSEPSPSP